MMTIRSHPMKVLHVVGRMNRGGVETWLMHLLRIMDREACHMDFLVGDSKHAAFDDEITQLGSKILYRPLGRNPFLYVFRLLKLLKTNGPYDVIHSHVHHFSGALLFLAWLSRIPVRIAHSHCDSRLLDSGASFPRKLYLKFMKMLIDHFATLGLAASKEAEIALANGETHRLVWRVSHCGIDLSEFAKVEGQEILRREWGIPETSIVLGHVGNFHLAKNHQFLLQVACEFFNQNPDSRLLLVGEGILQDTVRVQAKQLGIEVKIIFTGGRSDVPRLLGLMDVFLFPSLFEGLGIVVIEAQAAGLPIVIADSVPREVELIPELFTWMSLSQTPALWAKKCLQAYKKKQNLLPRDRCKEISLTSFNVENNWYELHRIYTCNSAADFNIIPENEGGKHRGAIL